METRRSDSILSTACMTPARALPILVTRKQATQRLVDSPPPNPTTPSQYNGARHEPER